MIYYDNEYKLMPFVASYTQHNEQHEQHVPNKDELKAYEQLGHITDLTFAYAEYTDEQRQRLAEVKDYPESAFSEVIEYVIEGTVPRGSMIEKDKELQALRETVDTLIFDNLIGGLF